MPLPRHCLDAGEIVRRSLDPPDWACHDVLGIACSEHELQVPYREDGDFADNIPPLGSGS